MNNPIKNFTKKEWILWIASLLIVIVSNLFSTDFDLLTLIAALIGVDFSDFCRERQCMGTDPDDHVQYPIWYHLVPISVLG